MTDDLDALVDAYRTEVDTPPHDAEMTRRSILRAARLRRQRRTLAVAASVALALVLTNATTFAWSTGRMNGIQHTLWSWAGGDPADSVPLRPGRADPPLDAEDVERDQVESAQVHVAAQDVAMAIPAPAEPNAPEETAPEPATRAAVAPPDIDPPAAATDTALEAELDALTPPPSAERVAFERAHRAHFEDRAYAAALSAWTAYLRAYPAGRLVPEARFNRAVCLLRLARFEEAEAALSRVARGGGHRGRDAEALLQALEEGRIRPQSP